MINITHYKWPTKIYFERIIDQIIFLGDLNRKIKILDYGCGKKKLSSKLNYPLVYNYDLNQKYTEISSIENLKIDAVVVNHVLMYMNKNKIDYLFKFIQELNPNAFFIIGISKQNFLSKIAMILSFNFDAHKGSITSYNEQISLIHTYFKIKKKYNIFFMTDIFYCVYKK